MKHVGKGSAFVLMLWVVSSALIHASLFAGVFLLHSAAKSASTLPSNSLGQSVPIDLSIIGDSEDEQDEDKPWEGGDKKAEDSLPEGIAVLGENPKQQDPKANAAEASPNKKPNEKKPNNPSTSKSKPLADKGVAIEEQTPDVSSRPEQDTSAKKEAGEEAGVTEKQKSPNVLGALGLGVDRSTHRKILGEAAACPHPVGGTWVAKRFSKRYGDWARFTMKIKQEGNSLTGKIFSRMWSGGVFDSSPPPCQPGRHDTTVLMPAKGTIRGDVFDFKAKTYKRIRTDCRAGIFSYLPDHFSGKVVGENLRVTNNDGGREINVPYRFHRTSCDI